MEYKLGYTTSIHWDGKSIYRIQPHSKILWKTASEIPNGLNKGRLIINLIANPTVLENNVAVFSAVFQTKTVLTFKEKEDPITDIVKMWNECYLQETKLFKELIKESAPTYSVDFSQFEQSPFESAYNLREILLQRKMVTLP